MTSNSGTHCISAESLSDFEATDLDIDAILDWAYVDDAAKRQRRIDLANRLPILVPMLVFDPENPWSQDVTEQLDRGVSLLECLTRNFPTKSPESAGALFGQPLALLGDWSGDVLGLMLAIECLEVDELPETDAEWKLFSDFSKSLHPYSSTLSGHVFRNLCCPSYLSSYAALRDAIDGDLSRLSLINDFSRYLGRWYAGLMQCPASDRYCLTGKDNFLLGLSKDFQNAGDALAEARLKQFSAIDLLFQALRWDAAVRQASIVAHASSDDPQLAQWPPLFEAPVVIGGYQVVSLTSASDVASEYTKLHLDIESVLSQCALGNSHVATVKGMDGGSRTVASIWIKGPEAGRYLAYDSEHRGENGRYAYQTEVDALSSSLELLWKPQFQENLVHLVDFHEARRSTVEQKLIALPYGYDVMESVLASVVPSSLLSI